MSFLDKLLDGVEVEWKALWELAEYSKTRINFKEIDKTNYVGVEKLCRS
jgi:type I restriction enzyme, S subunit